MKEDIIFSPQYPLLSYEETLAQSPFHTRINEP